MVQEKLMIHPSFLLALAIIERGRSALASAVTASEKAYVQQLCLKE